MAWRVVGPSAARHSHCFFTSHALPGSALGSAHARITGPPRPDKPKRNRAGLREERMGMNAAHKVLPNSNKCVIDEAGQLRLRGDVRQRLIAGFGGLSHCVASATAGRWPRFAWPWASLPSFAAYGGRPLFSPRPPPPPLRPRQTARPQRWQRGTALSRRARAPSWARAALLLPGSAAAAAPEQKSSATPRPRPMQLSGVRGPSCSPLRRAGVKSLLLLLLLTRVGRPQSQPARQAATPRSWAPCLRRPLCWPG